MLWQARGLRDATRRAPCKLREGGDYPRGPIEEIRIFVWRHGDWHPLPDEQQAQIKECLRNGETVFKVRQGDGYWTLDTTARTGWMQVGKTRGRPLKFVEMPTEFNLGASPHSAASRGLNMRLPHGPVATRGRCLVDAIYAEWEALAGDRDSLLFEDLVQAWRKSMSSSGPRELVVLEPPHKPPQQSAADDEELVRSAAKELWASANLQQHEPLHRRDWLHLRLLEVQGPSQFALLGLSETVREQGQLKGDRQLHWRLLDLFMFGCQRCRGPEDGLLSIAQFEDRLRASGSSLPKRSPSVDGRSSKTSSPSRPARNSSQPLKLDRPKDESTTRRPTLCGGAEAPQQAPKQPSPRLQSSGSWEESDEGRAGCWSLRVRRRLRPPCGGNPQDAHEAAARQSEEDIATQSTQLRQLHAFLDSFSESHLESFFEKYGEDEDFVTYYDFLNHMLERRQCPVRLHQYDLSAGRAWWLSPVLLCRQMEGIWHTGVVVFDREYWYGGRIFESKVGQTPYGTPTKVVEMGEATMRSRQELWHFVQRELQFEFTIHNYDVLTNNCNHFSDAVCSFLINQHIPDEVLQQPQVVMRTPVVALLRTVLNRQLGSFGGEGNPQAAAELRQGGGRGGPPGSYDVTRSTCSFTAEEEWEQVQEGRLVLYEYEPGWTTVARVDKREVDNCNLHWFDPRLGKAHVEEDVPSGAARLLPGCGPVREGAGRARLATRRWNACGLCA